MQTVPARIERSHANLEGAAAPSMRFAGVPLLPKSAASPQFQPVAPEQAIAAAPRQDAPATAADGRPPVLTSVPSLAAWSHKQLQQQQAAAAAAAGTATDPVNLVEREATPDLPAAAAVAATKIEGTPQETLQQPEAAGTTEEASGVPEGTAQAGDEAELRLAEVPVQAEAEEEKIEASPILESTDPFAFLQ